MLRPGGVVGLRDPDWGADLFTPATPLVEQWWAIRLRVLQHNGGQILGRQHRRQLLEAGFARAEAQASVSSAGSLTDTRRYATFLKAQLATHARTALAEGWVDPSMLDAITEEFDRWGNAQTRSQHASIARHSAGWTGARREHDGRHRLRARQDERRI